MRSYFQAYELHPLSIIKEKKDVLNEVQLRPLRNHTQSNSG